MYLGVDGGGTKTRAIVVDAQGQMIEEWHVGATNALVVGPERACQTMTEVFDRARQYHIDYAVFGLAGALRPATYQMWTTFIAPHVPRFRVVGDHHIAWAAFTTGLPGIVGIFGTGSIFYGETAKQVYRMGGYGYHLGDVGSGLDLARQATVYTLESFEGIRPRSLLTEMVAQWFHAHDYETILSTIYNPSFALPGLAQLAPMIFDAAAQGDLLANQLLTAEALKIMRYINSMLVQTGPVPVGIMGGLAAPWLPYLDLNSGSSGFQLVTRSAVHGAIFLARKWHQERNFSDDTH